MLELEFSDDGYRIYSFLRKRWVEATPEEIVRQNYVRQLVNKRLCTLDQMAEELEVGPERDRADLIIWSEPSEKETALSQPDGPAPLIVVEVDTTIGVRGNGSATGIRAISTAVWKRVVGTAA